MLKKAPLQKLAKNLLLKKVPFHYVLKLYGELKDHEQEIVEHFIAEGEDLNTAYQKAHEKLGPFDQLEKQILSTKCYISPPLSYPLLTHIILPFISFILSLVLGVLIIPLIGGALEYLNLPFYQGQLLFLLLTLFYLFNNIQGPLNTCIYLFIMRKKNLEKRWTYLSTFIISLLSCSLSANLLISPPLPQLNTSGEITIALQASIEMLYQPTTYIYFCLPFIVLLIKELLELKQSKAFLLTLNR